jgi:hypothetical protein
MKLEMPSKIRSDYAPNEERPLGSFLGLMGAYAGAVGLGVAAIRRGGWPVPERVPWRDVALLSVAVHRVSRTIAKDPVTSPFRAPFTRFAGTSGAAELAEEVRGSGARKAIGELVTCPFCLGQWVSTAFVFGMVVNPAVTRLTATVFTTLTAADLLQFAYSHVQQHAE